MTIVKTKKKRKLTLEYSVMASIRANVVWERKVLELSVTRDAARLTRESWERISACHRGTQGTTKIRHWTLQMSIKCLSLTVPSTDALACLKGIAQSPPPKVSDAILLYKMCVHFPVLRTTWFLLLKRTPAELLHTDKRHGYLQTLTQVSMIYSLNHEVSTNRQLSPESLAYWHPGSAVGAHQK